jgi:hypothetical protein
MQQCQRAGKILGVRLMLLDVTGAAGDAEHLRLLSFYASMGFRPLPGRPERLFILLSALPPRGATAGRKRGRDRNRKGERRA